MNRHEKHRKRLTEGWITLTWCGECDAWHYRLMWMQQQGWNKAPEKIGQHFAGVVMNDEWTARSLGRIVNEAAHEARMLAIEFDAGVVRLPME